MFPQVVDIARQWLRTCVTYHDDTFPGLLLLAESAERAASKIHHGFFSIKGDRQERILPMLRPYDPTGSTFDVDFDTIRPVYATDRDRCHVTHVVRDSDWELVVAQALEELPIVASYVKNDHLGFTIPYTDAGRSREYHPDFLVRLGGASGTGPEGDDVVRTLVVEVSGGQKPVATTEEKAATARNLWVPAVNNHGGFGRWGYVEVTDPTRRKADIIAAAHALYAGDPELVGLVP